MSKKGKRLYEDHSMIYLLRQLDLINRELYLRHIEVKYVYTLLPSIRPSQKPDIPGPVVLRPPTLVKGSLPLAPGMIF